MNKNILYCFDENYNYQAFSSIISLLDSIDEKICIHIIHNQDLNNNDFPEAIQLHSNLSKILSYKFNDNDNYFPNLENNHISAATYYRLFIDKYISKEIDSLIYLDADTICIEDPLIKFEAIMDELDNSSFTIAARTEKLANDNNAKRIGVKGNYFNAGVLCIDMNKWRKHNVSIKLVEKMNDLNEKIINWDQDVLNSYFNGQYLDLDEELNFNSTNYGPNKSFKILHFIGSKKPWYLSGMFKNSSEIYHSNFSKISKQRYHIVHLWKLSSLKDFVKAILSLKIFRLQKPILFIKSFIYSFR